MSSKHDLSSNKSILLRKKSEERKKQEEYFGDDVTNELVLKKQKRTEISFKDDTINFSYSQYFEFLIIHLVSFVLLGPLINIYTYTYRKNKALMYNLQFAVRNSVSFYWQNFLFLISVFFYYVIFLGESKVGDVNSIALILISYIVRASSIAGKYATYSAEKIKYIKTKKLTYKEIEAELMLIGWFQQKPFVVEREIDVSMKRQEIDECLFRINFIAPINRNTEDNFKAIVESHPEYYATHEIKEYKKCSEDGKEIWYYDARLIIEYFIKEFNKRDKTFTIKKFFIYLSLSFVYGMSPGLVRVFYGQTFHGENVTAILAFYLNSFSSGFLILTAIMFFISGQIDMRRRSFILRQLGQMISPKKIISYKEDKLLPTINLTDQLSLNTWLELRKITMDYGRRYFQRHEIFLPVIFTIGVLSLITSFVLFVVNFGYVGDQKVEQNKSKFLLGLNCFVMFYFFFGLLYQGAGINVEFAEHEKILKRVRQVVNDLIFFKDFYFAEHLEEASEDSEDYLEFQQILDD